MIGYTAPSNDVYIFFEGDDLTNLGHNPISGTYLDFSDLAFQSTLEVIVDDESCRRKMEQAFLNRELTPQGKLVEVSLFMMHRVYSELLETGLIEHHLGYCHIFLRLDLKIPFHEQCNYKIAKVALNQTAKPN